MAILRGEYRCPECGYTGRGRLGWLGIFLLIVGVVFFLLSWAFWPLFLIWPFIFMAVLFLPLGRSCPVCPPRSSTP